LLKDAGLEHTYREYTEEPLSVKELKEVFAALGMRPRELLRMRDAKPLDVTGEESDAELLRLMAEHPTLLQRPIGITSSGDSMRAVVGRPVENLLELS
jgi:arsenate reductase